MDMEQEDIEQTIPDRLEEFTRRFPDRVAFKSRNEALTWDALNKAANRIARQILAIDESRERPIALLVD
jgi:non-ribosomal peptide synthetase component F